MVTLKSILYGFFRSTQVRKSRNSFVVIYDVQDPCSEDFQESDERYYGQFSTVEEAAEIFQEFRKNQVLFNVRLCKVVGALPS